MFPTLSKILILLLLPKLAFSDTCIKSQIRIDDKVQSSAICYNENKDFIISHPCDEKTCQAKNNIKKFQGKIVNLLSEYSKPGFTLCEKIKGEPEIIEFYAEKSWHKADRCLFKDGSFISTDRLIKIVREKTE